MLRQQTKAALAARAMDFIRERQVGEIPRKARRSAARKLAKRLMQMQREEQQNANV